MFYANNKNRASHRFAQILTVVCILGTVALKPIGLASAQASAPSWTYTGSLNTARADHAAILLPNGNVLLIGGSSGGLNGAELYDPATGKWRTTGSLILTRYRFTATLLTNGKVLVAGGQTNSPTNTAELYDPSTGTWSLTGSMNKPRAWHSATLLQNGKVLVVGGYESSGYSWSGWSNGLDTAELYDPESGTWTITGSLKQGRIAHTTTLLQNGTVLVAGGMDSLFYPFTVDEEDGSNLVSAELYDPSSATWSATGSLNTGRYKHTATALRNGQVLVAAGRNSFNGIFQDINNTAELYDPTSGKWSYTSNLMRRVDHTATMLPNGRVLVTGGINISEETADIRWIILENAEIYDPATGNWSSTASLNVPRYFHTATLLANGKVLVAGGYGCCSVLPSAELYDSGIAFEPNPIDDAGVFVRQHYRDFLNREPDPDGFAFWTNDITACGGDAQCIEVKRINDSASFFLSIEFQETGYLVYRFYKASYGDLPNAPVPIQLNDFLPDTKEIGQDVIVKQSGWEQKLEGNKQAFAAEFVQRSRFVSAYPTSMSSEQFVDALFANAGVTPSATDRAAAINEFSFTATTADVAARARALRRVAENTTLAQQEFNRAFVLMQYFGYLRRNPNDAPEATLDFQGYNFWLNKLNQFDGDFVRAEMVRAFIVSGEYRQRFGP
jgi:N-acetylneuraminic acid mutarotase